MKKIMIILVCFSIFLSSTSIVLSTGEKTNQLSFTLNYSSPLIHQSKDDGKIEIFQEECGSTFVKSGYYIMPMDTKTFEFPKGTIIKSIDFDVTGIVTKPAIQPPQLCPEATPQNMQQISEERIYTNNPKSIDSWFTYDLGTGIQNNVRNVLVTINLYPIRYNQEEQTYVSAEQFNIDISYKTPSVEAATLSDEFELLIITPNEFSSTVQSLANHKNANGVLTQMVTLEEIINGDYFSVQGFDDQEKIKYFIKNAIESWGITSVLLIGGAEKMPVRDTHIQVSSSDRETFVSDLYYADIYNKTDEFSSWDSNGNGIFAEYDWGGETDEMDLRPDVYLGRLACTDLTELNTVVNKIINFENNEAYKEDWFSDLIVVGGDSFPGDDNAISEGEFVNEEVIGIMEGFVTTKLWASNGVLGGANPTGATAISNRIDEGAGFIDFSGHGNTNVWATHPNEVDSVWLPTPFGGYLNSNIKKLDNEEKLPIVVTGACSVGKYNKDDDCFSWAFVASENGGGIASLGSTGLGYAYLGEYVTYGLVEKMAVDMFRAYDSGVQTFGEMWSWGLLRNINSRMDGAEHKTVMEWQAFGDPTLKIAADSTPPNKPVLTGPDSGRAEKEYTYEAVSDSPESNELYYVFDWGDGSYSEWLGPFSSGETVTSSHIWDEKGEYSVRVASKNEDGKHSSWSDPLPVSMPLKHEKYTFFNQLVSWILYQFSIDILPFSHIFQL